MKNERLMLVVSGLSIALCVAAWAGAPGGQSWQWGGANCGCTSASPNPSFFTCRLCCRGIPAPLSPTGCLSFCAQATFPCQPAGPWWMPIWPF